jgi:outer membrane lipoprotein LolB
LHLHGAALTLDLASPLGNTLARVDVSPDGARLRAPGNDGSLQELAGPSAEALAEQVLGFALPVVGIGDWIEGRPAPAPPASIAGVTTGADGAVERIEQDGWSITVEERFAAGARPRRLTFERAARPASAFTTAAPAVTLRLVLDEPSV